MNLSLITAPFIGGFIGLITNSLAIKMLFRPHRAIYIGKFHVPFTPGLIPKEKERIATVIGEVISKYLLDDDTIKRALCDEKIKIKASGYLHVFIERLKQIEISLGVFLDQKGMEDPLNKIEDHVKNSVSNYIVDTLVDGDFIDELIEDALLTVQGQMNPIVSKIAKHPLASAKPQMIQDTKSMIRMRAPQMISDYIDQKYMEFGDQKICDLAVRLQDHEEKIIDLLWDQYVSFIDQKATSLIKTLNLQQIVEKRINEYDVAQLEQIILSISKKELNALVWLGGLLGMLMGFVNLLF